MDAERAVSQRRGDNSPAGGAPFAERLARGAATIVAVGRPPRVLFANPAALALFAAPGLAALEAHLFSPSSPGARRLPASPRLRRRSAAGRIAALLARPAAAAAGAAVGPDGDRLVLARRSTPDEIRAAAPPPEPQRAPPPRRFLWRLDGEERFGAVHRALRPPSATMRRRPAKRWRRSAPAPAPIATASSPSAAATHFRRAADELGRKGRRSLGVDVRRAGTRSRPPLRRLAWVRSVRRSGGAGRAKRAARRGSGRAPAGEAVAEAPPNPPQDATASARAAGPTAPPAERSAEIVVLRPAAPPPRPTSCRSAPARRRRSRRRRSAPRRRRQRRTSSHERDAFREIARALGARLPSQGDEARRATSSTSPRRPRRAGRRSPPASPASSPRAARPAADRRDRVARRRPLFLNRTLLSSPATTTSAEFRAADGLKRMFRGRHAQTLVDSGQAEPFRSSLRRRVDRRRRAGRSDRWDGAPATLISLRRSREVEYLGNCASSNARRATQGAASIRPPTARPLDARPRPRHEPPRRGLFGYDENEVAGENFLILFAPQSQSEAAARFEARGARSRRRAAARNSSAATGAAERSRSLYSARVAPPARRRVLRILPRPRNVEGDRARAGDGAQPPNTPTRARPSSSPASATRCARRCTRFSASPK